MAPALALCFLASSFGAPGSVRADGTVVSVDPTTVSLDQQGTTQLDIRVNASVEISGAQVSLRFNPGVVQIVSITRGAAWVDAGA